MDGLIFAKILKTQRGQTNVSLVEKLTNAVKSVKNLLPEP